VIAADRQRGSGWHLCPRDLMIENIPSQPQVCYRMSVHTQGGLHQPYSAKLIASRPGTGYLTSTVRPVPTWTSSSRPPFWDFLSLFHHSRSTEAAFDDASQHRRLHISAPISHPSSNFRGLQDDPTISILLAIITFQHHPPFKSCIALVPPGVRDGWGG
jgi:hypothetical protein